MPIKVEDYLIRLEDEIGSRRTFHDGSTMLFADNLKRGEYFPGFSKNELEVAELPSGLRLYLKRFYNDDETSKECISNEVVFSRLYNSLGVNAIKYYPLIVTPHSENENYGKDVAVASQDLNMERGIAIEPITYQKEFFKYICEYNFKIKDLLLHRDKFYGDSKYIEAKRMLLANFAKTGILDIICMMVDNHMGNKNAVRRNHVATAEDIISFDFEDSAIDNFNNCSYEDFKYQLENDTETFSGKISIKSRHYTYMGVLQQIRDLRDSEILSPECIELLENLIKLNFDDLIRDTEEETGLIIPDHKKDLYKKIIDISQETFCK